MSAVNEIEIPEPDRNIGDSFELLLTLSKKQFSVTAEGIGMSEGTLFRRRRSGGWSVLELALLARYFEVPASVLVDGPVAVMKYLVETGGDQRKNIAFLAESDSPFFDGLLIAG